MVEFVDLILLREAAHTSISVSWPRPVHADTASSIISCRVRGPQILQQAGGSRCTDRVACTFLQRTSIPSRGPAAACRLWSPGTSSSRPESPVKIDAAQ